MGTDIAALLTEARWSPYLAGAGIGVLSWFTFLISGKPVACSTTFARAGGMLERLLRGEIAAERPYYRKIGLGIDWQWMLVLGVVAGSFMSAALAGDFCWQWVPSLWESAFGPSAALRTLAALAGGVLLGFGARWAGGCTSGHGISGALQLSVASWISAACFFVGGIAAAHLLFRGLP